MKGKKRIESLVNKETTKKIKLLNMKGWDCKSILKALDRVHPSRDSPSKFRMSNENKFEAFKIQKNAATLKRN
jgi:hypothetical protein